MIRQKQSHKFKKDEENSMDNDELQQSFTFRISDKMTIQTKNPATNIRKRLWLVKEMEEIYEHETGSDFGSNQNRHQQCEKTKWRDTG